MTDEERAKTALLDSARREAERAAYVAALDKAKSEIQAAADENGKIPVPKAYRLMMEINRQITYRGLNARQVEDLRKHTAEEWHEIRARHTQMLTSSNFFERNGFLLCVGVASLIAILVGGTYVIAGALGIGYIWHVLSLRQQRQTVFSESYDIGFDDGIDRALGISPNERSDIADRAIQMEIDEHVLTGLERRETNASSVEGHA